MITLKFMPSGKTIQIEKGKLLFDAAIEIGLPVASSCRADFVCGKCNMQVVCGAENLSAQEPHELKLLRRDKKPESDRISCMTRIYGDCTVKTTYW